MYIKNNQFTDEDTLMETLFDFSLGDPSPIVSELRSSIAKELETNTAYQEYRQTLGEEDRLELEAEEENIRLAEALMERYDSFKVHQQKFYGIKGAKEDLLYEIDLV